MFFPVRPSFYFLYPGCIFAGNFFLLVLLPLFLLDFSSFPLMANCSSSAYCSSPYMYVLYTPVPFLLLFYAYSFFQLLSFSYCDDTPNCMLNPSSALGVGNNCSSSYIASLTFKSLLAQSIRERQNSLPMSFKMEMVNQQSLQRPLVGPQKEHSRVKLFIRLNSLHMTTLAVDSLAF